MFKTTVLYLFLLGCQLTFFIVKNKIIEKVNNGIQIKNDGIQFYLTAFNVGIICTLMYRATEKECGIQLVWTNDTHFLVAVFTRFSITSSLTEDKKHYYTGVVTVVPNYDIMYWRSNGPLPKIMFNNIFSINTCT